MPGHKQRAGRGLMIASVLLCLGCGIGFTRSSATTPALEDSQTPDMFVANNVDDSTLHQDGTVTNDGAATNTGDESQEPSDQVILEETPVPEASQDAPENDTTVSSEVSPEAANGVWTPVGSSWYFMVNGEGITGWFTDTDGERYYFDENAVMHTGWLDLDGKRYYLNADGVLQTGDVTIDGQIYHFAADGSLQGEPSEPDDTDKQLIFYMNTAAIASTGMLPSAATRAQNSSQDTSAVQTDSTADNTDPASASEETESNTTSDPTAETESAATPEPTVTPEPKGMIALTFDDGPSDFTDRLLDCLEANNAKATFFLVGEEILNFPEPLSRMEALGCEFGNHSYDHTDLTTLSAEDVTSQLSRTDQEIENLVGHGATLVRPPYGSYNDTVATAAIRPLILWSVDTLDWETQNVDSTVQNVMDGAQDGAIILMHDIFKESVDAAEIFIPKLIQEGYELVTVSELATAKGITLSAGTAYGSIE